MSPNQSNTQEGLVSKTVVTATLVGKEGQLAKLVDATGGAKVALCGAGEVATFVIEEGGAVGEEAILRPLNPNRQVKITSAGTIAGAVQVASDASGKIVAAASGDFIVGITEEDGVAGQFVNVRPLGCFKP